MLPTGTSRAAAISPAGKPLGPSALAESLRNVATTQPLSGSPCQGFWIWMLTRAAVRGCRAKGHGAGLRPRSLPARRKCVLHTASAHRERCRSREPAALGGKSGVCGAERGWLQDRPLCILLHVPCPRVKPLCQRRGHRKTALCFGSAIGCGGNTSLGSGAPRTPRAAPASRPVSQLRAPQHSALTEK